MTSKKKNNEVLTIDAKAVVIIRNSIAELEKQLKDLVSTNKCYDFDNFIDSLSDRARWVYHELHAYNIDICEENICDFKLTVGDQKKYYMYNSMDCNGNFATKEEIISVAKNIINSCFVPDDELIVFDVNLKKKVNLEINITIK